MKDDLSYLLSTIELSADIDTGTKKFVDCEFEILKQHPKWQNYVEQQVNLLQEAIKVFKNYDKTGNLKYFWKMLKAQNAQFTKAIFKQLAQYALLAYERGNLNDAYLMFIFISTCYPRHYKIYLYLGTIIQELHGLEEATTFFKSTTTLFPEPDLLVLAAENEFQRKNTEEARVYLQKAKNVLAERNTLTEYDEGLKTHIEELLNAFNS